MGTGGLENFFGVICGFLEYYQVGWRWDGICRWFKSQLVNFYLVEFSSSFSRTESFLTLSFLHAASADLHCANLRSSILSSTLWKNNSVILSNLKLIVLPLSFVCLLSWSLLSFGDGNYLDGDYTFLVLGVKKEEECVLARFDSFVLAKFAFLLNYCNL